MESSTSNKRYSGRVFGPQEIEQVRTIIRTHPEASRQQLSYRVCEVFDWRKSDGSLKDMSCRVALLRMHREGLIALPAPQHKVNPCRAFVHRTPQGEPEAVLEAAVHELEGLRLEGVGRKSSALWNETIDRYHYLGYKPLPGAQWRYFAYADDRLVGVLGFGAAAWKTGPRDEWIGWSADQRQRNLSLIVNNARFLIPPWIRVKGLASKLLAMAARRLADDWAGRYGYRPVLLETFVERDRFAGTCYRAANWRCVGQTQGRGKLGDHRLGQVPVKTVWVYPLSRDFREQLCR
jgi:GNAT superfamily N-acetyltransferase